MLADDAEALWNGDLLERMHAEEVEQRAYAARLDDLRRRRLETAAAATADAAEHTTPAANDSKGDGSSSDDDDGDDGWNWRRRGV